VPSVVYKNQRSTYKYKPSYASPLSSLHGKMGENSDGRTVGEVSYKPRPPDSTTIKNQTNDTNPRENKGKQDTSRRGSRKLLGLKKQETDRNAAAQLFRECRDRYEMGINSLSKVGSWDRLYTQKARTESDKQTKREEIGITARGEVRLAGAARGL
jgi:hypothetical protein